MSLADNMGGSKKSDGFVTFLSTSNRDLRNITLMRIKTIALSLLLAGVTSTTFAGTFYNSEAAFTMQLSPVFYLEDFSNFTFGNPLDGSQTSWASPGANGYGWTASAALGLYSNTSALSTNTANDPLTITFTGLTVTAFGGNFANTDITGAFIPGTVTINTSDGGSTMVTFGATEGFIGYTSAVPIVSITTSATSGVTNNWIQVDHFYTGAAVPEPGTIALLTLGTFGVIGAAMKRRRAA